MMELTKKGLYIAEDLKTQKQYLVAVKGIAPMLYITNTLSLDEFINSTESTELDIWVDIASRVNEFSWTPLSHKLIKPTPKDIAINLENYSVIKDNYDRFKELLTIGEDEKVLIEICTCEDISMEKAKELVKHLKLSYKS
jgi:hypothetical protein